MKMPNLTFCGGRETRQGLHVSFPELRCSPLESNFKNNLSTFENCERDRIRVINFRSLKRTKLGKLFKGTVSHDRAVVRSQQR